MDENALIGIIKVLNHKNRKDLANLLKNSIGVIEESSRYGSQLFSVLSTLKIYSSYKDYEKLKNLGDEENRIIFDAAIEGFSSRTIFG